MKCQRCQRDVPESECSEHLGDIICDDCRMDALYPAKPCDPWAVYLATRTRDCMGQTGADGLTPCQKEIYEFIKDRGKVTAAEVMDKFSISRGDLDGIVAALRHCELVKGQKEGDRIYLVPF